MNIENNLKADRHFRGASRGLVASLGVAVFGLGLLASPVRAVQSPFYAYGVESVTCQTVISDSLPMERLAYNNWVFGFLSGAGWGRPMDKGLRASTGTGINDWITNYCTANPKEGLPAAAVALANELSRSR